MTKEERYWLNRKLVNGKIEKRCSKCGEWLEENSDNFYMLNKSKPNKRFMGECKECAIKRSSKHQKENKEYYDNLKKKHYEENWDHYQEMFRDYRLNNLEYCFEKQKRFQRNNPEKIREYSRKRQQKNHKIGKKEWDACKAYFNNSCAYCGVSLGKHIIKRKGKYINIDLHKEHVDDQGANDLSNCVPSCQSCNSSKHTSTLEEWYNSKNSIFSEERLSKILKWIGGDYELYLNKK